MDAVRLLDLAIERNRRKLQEWLDQLDDAEKRLKQMRKEAEAQVAKGRGK